MCYSQLATRTEQKLIDLSHKLDGTQTAIESVIAETAEEAYKANATLTTRVDELQVCAHIHTHAHMHKHTH